MPSDTRDRDTGWSAIDKILIAASRSLYEDAGVPFSYLREFLAGVSVREGVPYSEEALSRVYKAGVPADYAKVTAQCGFSPVETIGMWQSGLPLEYVAAAAMK